MYTILRSILDQSDYNISPISYRRFSGQDAYNDGTIQLWVPRSTTPARAGAQVGNSGNGPQHPCCTVNIVLASMVSDRPVAGEANTDQVPGTAEPVAPPTICGRTIRV